MSDMTTNYDDGMNDAVDGSGDDKVIKGHKLKFTNDYTWVIGADTVIDSDRVLVVVDIGKIQQRWGLDDRPVSTQRFLASAKLDTDALNAAVPKEEWRDKFGKKVGPWEWCYCVYLIDPTTFEIFTFLPSTAGGGMAVRALRESVAMARKVRGPNLSPRVHLRDTFMSTEYGGRQRPVFEIIDYISIGGPGSGQLGAPVSNGPVTNGSAAQIEAKPVETKLEAKAAEPKPEVKADQPKADQKVVAKAAAVKAGKISPAHAKGRAS